MVRVRDPDTGIPRVLPGLAPVAMQRGRSAGRLICDRLEGRGSRPFRYRDKGSMATLGRTRAVADLHGVLIGGPVAWVLWLAVHLTYLIGFEKPRDRARSMELQLPHPRTGGTLDHSDAGIRRRRPRHVVCTRRSR